MKTISNGMIDAKILDDSLEARRKEILAKYLEHGDCEQHPYVKFLLEKSSLPTSVYHCFFQAGYTYGNEKNALTIAITHSIYQQDVPNEVDDFLVEIMGDVALEYLEQIKSILRKNFP